MQQKEYPQIYELGLGSLIGDFFQNVKDTVSGVAKAVAPIAPYVLPFLPIPGIGALSPALTKQLIGAGIGLAAGQKPVDVAKNMALQAGIGGLKGAFMRPEGATFGQGFNQGAFGIEPQISQSNLSQALNYQNVPSSTISNINASVPTGSTITNTQPVSFQVNTPPIEYATPSTEKSFFGKAGDFFMDTFDPRRRTENPRYLALKNRGFSDADIIKMGVNPESSAYYQYAPLGYATFTGIGALDQLLNPPKEGTGYDEAERERFTFSYAADGGEVTGGIANTGKKIKHPDGRVREHPKRIGEIAGPGTGTSDDIPAMLSDGEFVMTAKAVRNAGNGSRKEGARNMYKMMKSLENGGSLSKQSMGMV